MADETKTTEPNILTRGKASVDGKVKDVLVNAPPESVSAALAEYNAASDRVAIIAKYPFLVPILNNQTK